ncbi:MAG: GNAT family N-acetyltransferase [Clostridia bacterium]|nr:GNAT family N-acetyltransferase [Clostridia bacterium]
MTFETERLILRPWQEGEEIYVYEYCKEEELASPTGFPVHTSVENSAEIMKVALMGPETYAVVLKETGIPIGNISLMQDSNCANGPTEGELGYWLGKAYWGNGYIPEAGERLLKYAFEEKGIEKMWCAYYEGNEKSKRSQEKMGFKFERFDENVEVKLLGVKRNSFVQSLTKEEWEKRHD